MILEGGGLMVMFTIKMVLWYFFVYFLLNVAAGCFQVNVLGRRSGRIYSFWKSLFKKKVEFRANIHA